MLQSQLKIAGVDWGDLGDPNGMIEPAEWNDCCLKASVGLIFPSFHMTAYLGKVSKSAFLAAIGVAADDNTQYFNDVAIATSDFIAALGDPPVTDIVFLGFGPRYDLAYPEKRV